ncbi:MAG TPA: hypothetical protein VJR89_05160, partial [Polyangiales bacterium]|nr:hypothetical protein [Polyangiales bacterium]
MKHTWITVRKRTHELYHRLDELCEFDPAPASLEDLVFWFVQLVRWLRGSHHEKRGLRLRYLRNKLEQHPSCRDRVGGAINLLLQRCDVARLLAYGGIARDFHLGGAVREWLAFRVLPMACDTNDAVSILSMAFQQGDERWLAE